MGIEVEYSLVPGQVAQAFVALQSISPPKHVKGLD
jgi:hypothetical protein